MQWHLPTANIGREQVAASRSQSLQQGRTTNNACTQPFVMSPTWKSPKCPHPTGQGKCPEHQPICKDFILSGLKGPGEGRGKFTRTALSNVDSKMRSFFGQKKKERGGRREGKEEGRKGRQIHLGNCLLLPSLRFTVHSNKGTEKSCSQEICLYLFYIYITEPLVFVLLL